MNIYIVTIHLTTNAEWLQEIAQRAAAFAKSVRNDTGGFAEARIIHAHECKRSGIEHLLLESDPNVATMERTC